MYYWAQEMQKLKSITTNIQLQNNFYWPATGRYWSPLYHIILSSF